MSVKLYLVILLAYVICVSFTSCQHARRRMSMRVPAYFPLGPVAPTDGWESWSTWTKCSRTCGGGVQVRRRNCRQTLQRPTNINMNPWLCNGPNKLYKSCNLVPCPDGSVNTRRAQCSKYNSRLFAGNSYVWEPLSRGGPCELSCKARGHRFFVRHSDQVTDGTDCSYLELPGSRKKSGEGSRKSVRRVCVEGRCMMLKPTKVFLLLIFLQGFDWSFCDGSKALPSAGRTPGIIVPEVVSLSAEDDEGWKPVTDFRKQFPNLFSVKDENNFWTSAHEDNPTAMRRYRSGSSPFEVALIYSVIAEPSIGIPGDSRSNSSLTPPTSDSIHFPLFIASVLGKQMQIVGGRARPSNLPNYCVNDVITSNRLAFLDHVNSIDRLSF
ncbi:unnamed protein product [Clavelina lepadiformis]|uniref:Uncharacterized protein n=1 Tax=Clavelina lepadiformis TaxID=159417 RepID=A0ABP0GSU1_CLALP